MGCFPASKQGQLENSQEAVNIGESNQPKPAALLLAGSKNVLLLVRLSACHHRPINAHTPRLGRGQRPVQSRWMLLPGLASARAKAQRVR